MEIDEMPHESGRVENIDPPWQNSATVALQLYFMQVYDGEDYKYAIGPDGFARTFMGMFGDPWARDLTVLPGSLRQPEMQLPFPKKTQSGHIPVGHTPAGGAPVSLGRRLTSRPHWRPRVVLRLTISRWR